MIDLIMYDIKDIYLSDKFILLRYNNTLFILKNNVLKQLKCTNENCIFISITQIQNLIVLYDGNNIYIYDERIYTLCSLNLYISYDFNLWKSK